MGVPALSVVHLDAATASWWGAQLEERGIGSRVVVVDDPYRTRASVAVVDDQGAATVLNEAGAAPPPQVWRALSGLVLEQLEHPADPGSRHVLALCGSLPEGLAPAAVGALVAEAGRRWAAVVVDGSGAALEAALPARPAVVKPNQAEAAATTGEVDPVASARALVAAGARAALISCGADGVVLVPGEGAAEVVRTARPGERLTGNPTGAGDAATAAVAAHLAGVGIPDHDALLRDVVAWSAAAVLSPLAGDLDPADVARQRPLVRLDGPPPTSA